jgi:pyruvate kinase
MDIIATLGPSLLTRTKIDSLIAAGVTIFRVNGAHTDAHMVASIVEKVRRFAGDRARIMVDLPTNKVRVMNISEPILFGAGDNFVIHGFQLNYPDLCQRVRTGDEVIVNDGMNRLQVTGVNGHSIEFQAEGAGQLGNNRGLIFTREIHAPDFPYFFERDLELIEAVNDLNVELVGLSYLRHPRDKQEARRRIRAERSLVYKIETRAAFENLERLIEPEEKILIDRGDLAGEIGLLQIPHAQDQIIRFAHQHRVEVYVATQFLATMESSPIPHVAEVSALYEIVKLGVSGIQLSEETAVGKFPLEAVRWIRDVERLVNDESDIRRPRAAFQRIDRDSSQSTR